MWKGKHPEWMLLGSLLLCLSMAAWAADDGNWHQYRGPDRTGWSHETDIATTWPDAGPPEVWRRDVGAAFSGMIVVGNALFTMDSDASKSYLFAVNTVDGKERWRIEMGPVFEDPFGNGPRSTPLFHDGVVYALSAQGIFKAVDPTDGSEHWSMDFKEKFAAAVPRWGFCASPMMVDNMLIVETGGTDGRAITAFKPSDGSVIWSAIEDEIAYSSPLLVEHGGQRQLLCLTKSGLRGLTLQGEELWQTAFFPDLGITPAMPVLAQPDVVFLSASYDTGAKALRLKQADGKPAVEDLWEDRVMRNHFNPSVAYQGHVFGFDNATLKCVDPVNGKQVWAKRGFGKGSLMVVDGHFLLLSERGKLHLVEASVEAYREKAAHQVLSGRSWTSPVLAGKKLFLRNRTQMVCLDLSR